MGLLTTSDIVLLIGPNVLKKWVYLLLLTLSYWLVGITLDFGLFTTSDIVLFVGPNILRNGLLTTSDIVLLVGPNILRSGSTYY